MTDKISIEEMLKQAPLPLVGFGIVNPMGPTLMGFSIGRVSSGESGLFWFSLNPFSQNTQLIFQYSFDIETVTPEILLENYDIEQQIIRFLKNNSDTSGGHGTPTFLLTSNDLDSPNGILKIENIIKEIIESSDDPQTTLDRLKKFPLNVWDRVTDEMNGIGNLLQKEKQEKPAHYH